MSYLTESVGSVLEPKLLGIYEREISRFVESLVSYRPEKVIDIGAAEGYYAVGFAMRILGSEVIAFEAEATGQRLIEELAGRNGVAERINIRGYCDVDSLSEALDGTGRLAIVCDAEGAELQLLDPAAVPGLTSTAILVELHPRRAPGVKEIIRRRFEATHRIESAKQEPRTALDFPFREFPVSFFPSAYVENAVSEFRQPWEDLMEWFWMVPK
jgi:hypothetical protein